MCEFYWAYARYTDLMDLTERLFGHIARTVTGSDVVSYQGQEINLGPGWGRLTFHESLEKVGGYRACGLQLTSPRPRPWSKRAGRKVLKGEKLGKVQAKLFDIFVEPKLIQPHFIYHLSDRNFATLASATPKIPISPTASSSSSPAAKWALPSPELNDPVDQRLRFEEQVREKEAGDDEAHRMDDDYVRALEYGMPPAAGRGRGHRPALVMLLTDQASIREVILFPLLRPEGQPGS